MAELPSGTVTFLFTDIEGSTRLWELDAQAMWAVVERHFSVLEKAIADHHGVRFKTIGDAIQAAFPDTPPAVAAAYGAQVALRQEDWGKLAPLRVRMAIHVGEATPRGGDYLAPCLNRLARLIGTGYGEQILISEAARVALGPALPAGCDLQDLGSHRLRDLLQPEHVYQLRGPGLVVDFPPLKSLDRHLHNLPAQPTALLGREAEVTAVREALGQDRARLVTLTGPGGTGKTRLALQVAAELVEEFPDGVWFVPLAMVNDPKLVAPAIAQALGVRETASEPLLHTLQGYLEGRHAMLLLDNFEHVTAAAPDVAALLAACPRLQVLVTSREPLRIAGEREQLVAPLALPGERQERSLSPDALLEFPAIRLFVERAQAVRPDFTLSDTTAQDIATIARRLDGLPLAIELAAARVRVLEPAQLLARLDNRLKLLTGGRRDLPARQQTLRAAIEWSYDLLVPDEQVLFAHLAVFSGGCTVEAAEAVCHGAGQPDIDVLDGLDSLTQKSLLRPEYGNDGAPRFTVLETIREFGLEQLDMSGNAAQARRAHAAFVLALSEEAEPHLTSSSQVTWLNRLSAEHDNVRSALRWLEQSGDGETRLRLVAALWRFWWMRGHLAEGRAWLESAVTGAGRESPDLLARALSGTGILAESQGDYEAAVIYHEKALALGRTLGDQVGIASSLTNLGIIQRIYGDYERSTALHEQALTLWRELSDKRGVAGSLFELGQNAIYQGNLDTAARLLQDSLDLCRISGDASAVAAVLESRGILAFYQADYVQAASSYEECLTIYQSLGDARMTANTLANLGEVQHLLGNEAQAEALFQEALTLLRDVGEKRGEAFVLLQLGNVKLAQNDLDAAMQFFTQSLVLRQGIGEKLRVIESLEAIALAACTLGEPATGARVFSAADAHRRTLGTPFAAASNEERESVLAAARQSLGKGAFAQAWEAGEGLTLEEVVAEVLGTAPTIV